ETDLTRHRIVVCGAIAAPAGASFPDKLLHIHQHLSTLMREHRPDCVAIENLFHAVNVRSALKLGHARGVAMLAAVEAGVPDVERSIHTHVREDTIAWYGLATLLEQELFERLIGIGGIGPKLALAVLAGIEPLELIRAIERGDVARLTAIPGVGKKTSERIVLELKDRLPRAQPAAPAPGGVAPDVPVLRDDVVSALVNLGYHRP